MARRKKSSGIELAAIGIAGVVALIAAIPREMWIVLGLVAAGGLALYLINKAKKSGPDITNADVEAVSSLETHRTRRYVDDDMPVRVAQPGRAKSSGYSIPAAPKAFGSARWIPPNESIEVAGVKIPGGMIYVGTALTTPLGENDPCLIHPGKPISANGDYTQRQFGYWPSYSEIPPSARRAYLRWLADGRRDPACDIGYVFLFFYGLERRAIIDAANDPQAEADWPAIANELRRLLAIYGGASNSFQRYAGELLNWVSVAKHPEKLYEKPVPALPKTFELPLYVRLALGQAAVDGVPVPGPLALAWARLDPNIPLRTPAKRCVDEFDRLFLHTYNETFGDGIILPRNRTKLKLMYQPASAGFHGYRDIQLSFGETPDVTALTAPIKKLSGVVDNVTKALEPFSRFVGKNPDARTSLEGALQLPPVVWPIEASSALDALNARVTAGLQTLPFQDLLAALGATGAPSKDKTLALARALESRKIGMEPDVLGGARHPKPTDPVVLYQTPPADAASHAVPAYQAAQLTLQLASAVAAADGEMCNQELDHLQEEIQSWGHFTPYLKARLVAHVHLLKAAPVSLTGLKKKLEPLAASVKETIAAFMATVAQSDGTVSPAEVKMLEKIYKALGVDAKKVFSDIHAVAVGSRPGTELVSAAEETGFRLDPARIAALQSDTEQVSKLLAGIFTEEPVAEESTAAESESESEDLPQATGILGLDETHAAFARLLLSRPAWTRDELQDVSADLALMLDGALERINDAAFDAHDMPFTEGEDPVEINADIREKLAA